MRTEGTRVPESRAPGQCHEHSCHSTRKACGAPARVDVGPGCSSQAAPGHADVVPAWGDRERSRIGGVIRAAQNHQSTRRHIEAGLNHVIELRAVITRLLRQQDNSDGYVDIDNRADTQRILCNREVIGDGLVRPRVAQITVRNRIGNVYLEVVREEGEHTATAPDQPTGQGPFSLLTTRRRWDLNPR